MGLVIYQIIVAFWKRINRSNKSKEIVVILTETEVNNSSQIKYNLNAQDVFQISDYIENDVDIVDYDDFSKDSRIFTSPNHFLYRPTLPYCNSLPNSPKASSVLNKGLSSPYLYGTDRLQSHIFDDISNELAQLKRDLKEIKTRIKKFSRQYYVISANIDNCNHAVEEFTSNDCIHQLKELNEEESRSLDLEEKIRQLCQQLELCEDSTMTTITDNFSSVYLPEGSLTDHSLLSPSLLYDEEWSTKENEGNNNRWNFDFDL